MTPINYAIIPYSSQTIHEFIQSEVTKWKVTHKIKRRAFLSSPIGNSFTTSKKNNLKDRHFNIIDDYRKEVPLIRQQILQSQMNHNRMENDGTIFLPNFLGLNSFKHPLLQSALTYSSQFEPLIIETGDDIYTALKSDHLEALYFNKFEKIIVLNTAELSNQDLRVIFEKHTFKKGFYPIVEDNRTIFGDLKVHLTDEPQARLTPYLLPSKEEIYSYLMKDKCIKWFVCHETVKLISEKLENGKYIPDKTLIDLINSHLQNDVALQYNHINALNIALTRCAKGFPARK